MRRDRLPPYWAYLEQQDLRRGSGSVEPTRAPDVVELGAREKPMEATVRKAPIGGGMESGSEMRRYGAPRIGDVSAVRAAERVAEGVARIYRPDVVPTGTLADVLG